MLWKHQKLLYLAHVVHLQNLVTQDSKQSQSELVEKAPTKLEETIEEGVHLVSRNDFCEKCEIPVSREYFNIHTDLTEVLIKVW